MQNEKIIKQINYLLKVSPENKELKTFKQWFVATSGYVEIKDNNCPDYIILKVCEGTNITKSELMDTSCKQRKIAYIRFICYFKIANKGYSQQFIADYFKQTRANVLYGINQYKKLRGYKDFKLLIKRANKYGKNNC